MTGLVSACIAPHGGNMLPELMGAEGVEAAATHAAMQELGRRFALAGVETVIVLTPHGVRVAGQVAISDSEQAAGELAGLVGRIAAQFAVNRQLAHAIARAAAADGVPTALINYGASSGPASQLPLDWGALIPLWYMGANLERKPQVVIITPTRSLPLPTLVAFGGALARAAQESGQRVGLIASADQAHAHAADGPYGFDPAAPEYDGRMVAAVKGDRLEDLLALDPDFVDAAKPDSLWQTVILHGARRVVPMRGEFLSYERPTYFGMLCAAYRP